MTYQNSIDLPARAHQTMLDEGFAPDLPTEAVKQVQAIETGQAQRSVSPTLSESIRDLRGLLWSSIDNDSSRDLDQIEVAEQLSDGSIRVLIGIADVDALVPAGSPIDRHAAENTVSVYTGVTTFPMLPEALSTDLTSLLEDQDRLAVVVEMVVSVDGTVASSDLYQALVTNHSKLTYDEVGDWLEGNGQMPQGVSAVTGLEAQIRLQRTAAEHLHAQRRAAGALEFETVEAQPVMENGQITGLAIARMNTARSIIENFMVAVNTVLAGYLEATGLPTIQRVVREPERWSRIVEIAATFRETLPSTPNAKALSDFLTRRKAADPVHFPDLSLAIVKLLGAGEYAVVRKTDPPEGHFGLAVYRYTHSTAPNRRYADLVIQRAAKAVMSRLPPPYTDAELTQIAVHCTEREGAARKVERKMRKVAAAALLSNRIGDVFRAIVTGVTNKGVFARVTNPPVEGRIVEGERGLDVGDSLSVRLIATDPERGFIDFAHD